MSKWRGRSRSRSDHQYHKILTNKYTSSAVRSTKKVLEQSSTLQDACYTSIARVTGGCMHACPGEGYRSVTSLLLLAGSTGLRRRSCSAHGNGIIRIEGNNKTSVTKCFELTFGVGYLGLPGSYASSCALPVNMTGQRRSSPGLKLGLSMPSSHDGTCGGRRWLPFRCHLSFAFHVMQVHTPTPALIERRPTREIWRSAVGLGQCTLDPRKALRTPNSHTTMEDTN